jgi:hypothetical protein
VHSDSYGSELITEDGNLRTENLPSAVAKVFGVGGGIAEVVVDEYSGLAGEFETLAAFVAGHEVVEAHHVGSRLIELLSVFQAGAARQLLFLAANFPAHRKFEILVAARADQLDLASLFFFCIERALVHGLAAAL